MTGCVQKCCSWVVVGHWSSVRKANGHMSLVLVDVVTVLENRKSFQEPLTKQQFLCVWNLYSVDFENKLEYP